ncbi:MAG: minor capsid protein [Nostoc sp.]|uniref:minor capsid protein n=1 Tax=Nostoc sp. TaxID=1180 RepID=UPI002FF859FE
MNDAFDVVRRFDSILQTSEESIIKQIFQALATSYAQLEDSLRRSHDRFSSTAQPNLTGLQRSALLLQEVEQLLNLLPPTTAATLETEVTQLINQAAQNGSSMARELVATIAPDTIILPSTVPVEALKSAVSDAMTWLTGTGTEFKTAAKQVIAQGLIQNKGTVWTMGVLRRNLGISKRNAESIARTATLQATDQTTRECYETNSIGYVQRVSAEDERVCGFCALRCGNIYRLNEAFAILHVRCRCYLMPVKPEWIASGLVDLEWMRSHHATTAAIAQTPLNPGLVQFERARGLTRPATPVWTPNGGFQDADFARAAGG